MIDNVKSDVEFLQEVLECCSHTYKHGSSCSDLRPVALEELHDWDVIEVQHAWKVLDLQTTKHALNIKQGLLVWLILKYTLR